MNQLSNLRPVSPNERVTFRCKLCGGCCRCVKDSIMLEPMDIYYLSRLLRNQGEPVSGTEDMLARYAHPVWLAENFPVFLLNTTGASDTCVFLKGDRCSIYEARPRVCRMYPFSAAPSGRGKDFHYFLCTEKSHHFADGLVTVEDWFAENFSNEMESALKADFDAIPIIGKNIQAMGDDSFQSLLFQFLYYRYYNYELNEPFLPQFRSNLEELRKLTGG